jgi:hypothetical protein
MTNYKEYVSFLAQNKINKTFINSDEEHALDVFVNLFKSAEKIVRIFAGCLTSKVSNESEYIIAISDFIERGGEIKILLNKYNETAASSSNLIKRLSFYKYLEKPILVKRTEVKPYFASDPNKNEIHFTVIDNLSYRIETDVEARTADCNFNNEPLATNIVTFFDKVFESIDSIDVDIISLFKTF